MNESRWYVLGAGSIGRLFAERLARTGCAVQLLRRGAARPQPAPTLLLVATKAPDVLDALAPHVAGDGHGQLALLLQNGMGISEAVRKSSSDIHLEPDEKSLRIRMRHDGVLQPIETYPES